MNKTCNIVDAETAQLSATVQVGDEMDAGDSDYGIELDESDKETEEYMSFRDFYHQNFSDLVKLAYLFVRDLDVAQDVTQDTLVSVCKRYDHLSAPKSYTRVALVNKCKSYIRSRIYERQKLERISTNSKEESNEEIDYLELLDILKPKQKTAVILRYYLGFSDKEIAKVINCRAASVSSLIMRSLNAIKQNAESASN